MRSDVDKQGSYFIVVSRGGLYDLNALVQALDNKRLAGAMKENIVRFAGKQLINVVDKQKGY